MPLRCKASHPDANRKGQLCQAPVGAPPAEWQIEFAEIVERMPDGRDDRLYLPCTRKRCGAVNVYRVESKVALERNVLSA